MTILFRQDWLNFPTAIIDYKTTNTSFLRLAALYKAMGVENCEFILALYQPELQGVDPYDETLTDETKFKIAMECKYNPWYYFREVCRIPPTSGTVPVRFKANRGNIALYWCFFNHIDFGLIQPRQTGKSVSTDCLMTGIKDVWANNTTMTLITKDLALRNNNVERLKEMRNLLPDYIYTPNRADADNSEVITNVRLGNRYKTAVGRNDKIAADKLGRGLTVPILQFDELAYINLISLSLPVALSSGSAARDEAARNNQMYGSIYTTTAGNINSRDGAYAHEFLTGGLTWSEHYFDLKNREQLVKIVEKGSSGNKPLMYGAFNHRQLGYTDEWLYRKLRETASYGELADRDYMNIWTTGNEGSPLTTEQKTRLKSSERDPDWIEITSDSYVINWYIPKGDIALHMNEGRFVMGCDPSETLGENNDATTLLILDTQSHDVVATCRLNETNITNLAKFVANILIKYPTITFIPERKSTGIAILDTLFVMLPANGIDPFKRVYNRVVDEPETYPTEYREIQKPLSSRAAYFYDKYRRFFGFVTAGSGGHSRDALYVGALGAALELGAERAYDKILIGELLSLSIRNGRIDHSKGAHDDMVISYLLTHWFCTKAKNLAYYGINPNQVFSTAKKVSVEKDPMGAYKEWSKQSQMAKFNEAMEEFKHEEDPMTLARLEQKLKHLSSKIDVQEVSGVGIDAMIKHAHEERLRKAKTNRFGNHTKRFSIRQALHM